MTTLTIAPKTDFVPLESNWYVLTLQNYELRDRDADKFHAVAYQDVQFQWSVAVPDGDPAERRSWANVPQGYNEKSKLIAIGVALGMIDPAVAAVEGVKLKLDQWVNKRCRGNIVEVVKPDGTLSDKIDGYAPYKAKAAAPKAKAAPPPVEDEDEEAAF